MVIQMRFKLDEVALEVCHGEEVDLRDGAIMVMENWETMNLAKMKDYNLVNWQTSQNWSMDSKRVYHTTLDSFIRPKSR